MLSKKMQEPQAVLAMISGVVLAYVFGNVAFALLHSAGVHGFRTELSVGSVLLATLSFHGTVFVMGTIFVLFQRIAWRDLVGDTPWLRCLKLAIAVLLTAAPIMIVLKVLSDLALHVLGLQVEEQTAVKLIIGAKLWVRVYLGFFAVVLAPVAEEFFFRGVLFSFAKRYGWPKVGWIGVSLLFALIHTNAPTFLPLFLLALCLTWLYERTGGLLAPIMAHGLFNLANLILLLVAERYNGLGP